MSLFLLSEYTQFVKNHKHYSDAVLLPAVLNLELFYARSHSTHISSELACIVEDPRHSAELRVMAYHALLTIEELPEKGDMQCSSLSMECIDSRIVNRFARKVRTQRILHLFGSFAARLFFVHTV